LLAAMALLPACQSRLVVGEGIDRSGVSAGAGGSGGVGGSGGSGGSPFPTQSSTGGSPYAADAGWVTGGATAAQLLDDMEDGSPAFSSPAGVSGSWQTSVDASPTPVVADALIAPLDLPRAGSSKGCHARPLSASPGAVDVMLALQRSPKDPSPADLSAYEGVAFWARSSTTPELVVAAADAGVPPGREFWSDDALGNPWPARRLALTPRWERYVLLFEDFSTSGDGGPDRRLDLRALAALHFIGPRGAAADFWIDDVVLLCRGSCPPAR
jgi:hypothetical protein